MKKSFQAGQRYISTTEPELGLGIILEVEARSICLLFPGIKEERRYGMMSHPLKRVRFSEGDIVKDREGNRIEIEQVIEEEGLLFYAHGGELLCESDLSDSIGFNKPQERLFNGLVDGASFFNFRLQCMEWKKRISTSKLKGLVGARISLIPHQLYIAKTISDRVFPRVLLADEVGLGKTIEAGLILHSLIIKGVVKRALVIVPDSLTYQWFIEMLRRFQLPFAVISQETYLEKGTNPFVDNELAIVSMGLLKGSEVARELLSQSDWDMVVVDEAHQIAWSPEEESLEYEIVKGLSSRVKGLLLLTATPEQLGQQSHFSRLKLIDPDRFYDYQSYLNDCSHMKDMASFARSLIEGNEATPPTHFKDEYLSLKNEQASKEDIVKHMIDCHGTGRIFFRNTRETMASEFDFFPKRILHGSPLKVEGKKAIEGYDEAHIIGESFKRKANWLVNFLEENPAEKILLICHSKDKIVRLEKFLMKNLTGVKIGLFHSGLSLLARDRQAAYFHEPDGARILLCTEIGSEGRNFEFAHDLILFDLPKKPDLLEQRIGRLDRIGQKADIKIHVPYIQESWEEILFSWYHHGLGAFEKSLSVATAVFAHFKDKLGITMEKGIEDDHFQEFLKETQDFTANLLAEVREGRDVLVEKNSFNQNIARQLVKDIYKEEVDHGIRPFMELAFEQLGVDVEELDDDSFFIKPSHNMFIPHFPELESEGKRITYSRQKALEREDLTFLTLDHPMVSEVINLVMAQNIGNVTVATRKKAGAKKSFMECFFLLEGIAPAELEGEKYFPPTLIRVLIDKEGNDFDEKWPIDVLEEKLIQAPRELTQGASKIPREQINKLISMAQDKAREKANSYVSVYRENLIRDLDNEIERLNSLKKKNPNIKEVEIDFFKKRKVDLLKVLDDVDIQLDCFRLII